MPAADSRLPREAIEAELRAVEELVARRDALAERATEIRTRLEAAGRGHDVEDALAEVERCRAALADARERDMAAAVGKALADAVQRATRDHDRPAVFHRARELFERFTRGRYTLDLSEGDSPSFRAVDNQRGVGQPLDELSSGTRVQLLLAVRIAFVEVQERGVRLPLVLDEALGNSDDVRARAIIEATASLARDGRQVFYFTAQPDEVKKWQAFLSAAGDVPHQIIDLAKSRRLDEEEALPPLETLASARPTVPSPDGMSHAAYGRALGVPPIDPLADSADGVHLWYLVDDCEALHALLELGVERWGQLRTLTAHGGFGSPELRDAIDRAGAAARVMGEALSLASIGRGRPVDRQALLDSGAVSDTFIDRIAELCAELDGDARALASALGDVPRFRSDKADALREHLEREGYLDPREPLAPEDVRVRLLAAFAAELGDGGVDPALIDRCLAVLGMQPA